ncbi:hypothetical protein Glove_25g20 [Diversispora epigaea]|uniref:Galactose oxidase n=1 Tax=Diversispora epigaea TaxID=1348612 RepID=A0A397JUW8_9GLOM|nr:hypothetical protein Glove_25g20 [Diversispora epigaea]
MESNTTFGKYSNKKGSIVVALFNPGDRYFHENVHFGDKLFFLGDYNNNHLSDFFYLDLSISFHKDIPPWYNLDFREIPFGVSKAASSFGGSDNATIFLIGGERIVALFNPGDRYFHENVHFGDKLFFLGDYNNNHLSDFFYLDLSISFHKDIPPWYNLDFREIPFGVSKAASSFGGSDNATIFLIGGERRVTDDKGRIYFYGGRSSNSRASSNKLQILESLKITWFESSSRYGHTVTLLSNGIIVIIGRYVNDKSGIDKILLYNTNKSNWTFMITQGISLSERARHTAALTDNGRIIVYGGIKKDSFDPNLVVLDTNFQPFKWLTPEVNHPPLYGFGLYGHSANIVGNYMILAFGKFKIFDEEIYNRHTYLMNVRNYTWVSYFHPKRNVDTTTQVITTQVITTQVITTQVITTTQVTTTQVVSTHVIDAAQAITTQVPTLTFYQLIFDLLSRVIKSLFILFLFAYFLLRNNSFIK